jgi:hypothetical protein
MNHEQAHVRICARRILAQRAFAPGPFRNCPECWIYCTLVLSGEGAGRWDMRYNEAGVKTFADIDK